MNRTTLIFIMLLILFCTICISCHDRSVVNYEKSQSSKMEQVTIEVPFIRLQNYFLKNIPYNREVSELQLVVIKNELDFHARFGMTTTMGVEGKPTEIDFSKDFVIALIDKVTDISGVIDVNVLKLKDNRVLELSYKSSLGEKQSYSTQRFVAIAIDKEFEEYAIEIKCEE